MIDAFEASSTKSSSERRWSEIKSSDSIEEVRVQERYMKKERKNSPTTK
jgi:hypothetical protein